MGKKTNPPVDATVLEPDGRAPSSTTVVADTDTILSAEERVASEWQVGDVILDLYEVKHLYTGGAMGVVYRVRHRGWNMDLAVKSPRPDYFATPDHKANFVRECETWIALGLHPHTVSCHYVRSLGGIPRVFAEYVEGGSLADWINSGKLYEGGPDAALERILDVAIQFAWGLGYAHEKDLIHQDIKPANVMLTPEGVAKVTDFGLARARPADEVKLADSAGGTVLIKGRGMTNEYRSPEQAAGAELSRKTDIWSWAVSLLEMFTGERTWLLGEMAADNLQGCLEAETGQEFLCHMPEAVAELLQECFQLNPAERPGGMGEVAARLQQVYREDTGAAYPRTEPKATELLADSLNNRALSLFDLGRDEEAVASWEEALQKDPTHLEVTFNLGYWQWQQASIDDMRYVRRVSGLQRTHGERPEYWDAMTTVHLERGDHESAVKAAERLPRSRRRIPSELPSLPRFAELKILHVPFHIRAVQYSPTARYAVAAGGGKTIELFDGDTLEHVRSLEGVLAYELRAVTFYSDGFVIAGTHGHDVMIWRVEDGEKLGTWKIESPGNTMAAASVSCFAITSDVRRMIVSYHFPMALMKMQPILVMDLKTTKRLQTLQGHVNSVYDVCLMPGERHLLSGGIGHEEDPIKIWDLESGACLGGFGHPGSPVKSLAVSSDGRVVLAGGADERVRLYDFESRECVRVFEGHTASLSSVVFADDERFIVSASYDNTVKIWDRDSARCLRTLEGHTDAVSSIGVHPQRGRLLSGSLDHSVRLWELRPSLDAHFNYLLSMPMGGGEALDAQSELRQRLEAVDSHIAVGEFHQAMTLAREAQELEGYERSSQILDRIYRCTEHGSISGLRGAYVVSDLEAHEDCVTTARFSPDGLFAATGGMDQRLCVWDVESGVLARELGEHSLGISTLGWSPDGAYIASGTKTPFLSKDKGLEALHLWEVSSGCCVTNFGAHEIAVGSLVFLPDNETMLTGDWEGTGPSKDRLLRLWNLETGRCLRSWKGHENAISAVDVSTDGRYLLSGSRDRTLRLWGIETKEPLRVIEAHAGMVRAARISPDGRWLLSAGADGLVRLWDAATGERLQEFSGHEEAVHSIVFSRDGLYAVSCGEDRRVMFWELRTGLLLGEARDHTDAVLSVDLRQDSRHAISAGYDRIAKLWTIDWEWEFSN